MGIGREAGAQQARAGGGAVRARAGSAVRIPPAVPRAVIWRVQVPAERDLSGLGPAAAGLNRTMPPTKELAIRLPSPIPMACAPGLFHHGCCCRLGGRIACPTLLP